MAAIGHMRGLDYRAHLLHIIIRCHVRFLMALCARDVGDVTDPRLTGTVDLVVRRSDLRQ